MLVAAPHYLAEHGTPRTTADLAAYNCLIYTLSRTTGPDCWMFGADAQTPVPVRGTFRASNSDALVAAAVAGLGVAYQPTFLVGDEVRAGRLTPLKLDLPWTSLPGVFAVYPASRKPLAKVRAGVDYLSQRFGMVPPWDRQLPI